MYMSAAASRQDAASSVVTPSSAAASGSFSARSAALARLCCAIRLVYRLLSLTALYSSGPVTPSIRNLPAASCWPRERQSRAVSTSSGRPTSCSNASSSVASRYFTTALAISAFMWKAAVPAGQYPEHSWPRIVRHGNAAPSRPSSRACSFARSSTRYRHRSASAAADGSVYVRTGSTNVSVSQNVCPSYPVPVSPFAAIARYSARAPACMMWNSPNRTACWISTSPSTSTSAPSQNESRYRRCSRTSPSQPVSSAAASAPETWSMRAGRDRWLDQPYPRYFTRCSSSPSGTSAAAISRPRSGNDSDVVAIRDGPETTCSMPAASRSLLDRVPCTSTARGCFPSAAVCSSLTSGAARTASARGSPPSPGTSSLATSSDITTRRSGSETGLTV